MGACRSVDDERVQATLTSGVSHALPQWKRVLDLALVSLAAPLILPVVVLIAIAIKLSSPGPALFRQERVGYREKPFTLLKFRTMKVGADAGKHEDHLRELIAGKKPLTKIDEAGDDRLVPFGRMLRVTGLDELPQLVNVVKSEMSLVGPRPCLAYECRGLTCFQRRRFCVLPGITGLWQTRGKNRTTFDEMIELDIAYLYERSLWGDLKILIRTIPTVMGQVTRTLAKNRAAKAAGGVCGASGINTVAVLDMNSGN
jgi:exopolysaccharide production protein ExoY